MRVWCKYSSYCNFWDQTVIHKYQRFVFAIRYSDFVLKLI